MSKPERSTKLIRTVFVSSLDGTIEQMMDKVAQWKRDGAELVGNDDDYDSAGNHCQVIRLYRYETDAEYAVRCEAIAKKEKANAEHERQQQYKLYLSLKEKFENENRASS